MYMSFTLNSPNLAIWLKALTYQPCEKKKKEEVVTMLYSFVDANGENIECLHKRHLSDHFLTFLL